MNNLTDHPQAAQDLHRYLVAQLPPTPPKTSEKDLFVFAGQSNMAGRGVATQAPDASAIAQEFRAVTAPDRLLPLREPFGVNENRRLGINEPGMKTGSLVSALALAYHAVCGRQLIGVSAAKGGSAIAEWQPGQPLLTDALARTKAAIAYCGPNVSRRVLVWCQGETDGDLQTSSPVYQQQLTTTLAAFQAAGVNNVYLIRIGQYRDDQTRYAQIQQAQDALCRQPEGPTLCANVFQYGASWGLMKDEFHYRQAMYDLCGMQAGINIAQSLA